jgi:hypothetical protein
MEANVNESKTPSFVITGKTLFESPVPDNPMLWGHLLPKVGIALIVGSSDGGKSSLMRQFVDAIVFKEPEFLGQKLDARFNSAIYVSSEDTDEDIKRIMKREHLAGRDSDPYDNISYIFDITGIEDKIRELLNIRPVDCVILDSLNDFLKGDVNSAFYSRILLENIRSLVMQYKCLFVIIAHYRKNAPETNPTKNDVLGSQSFEAKARVVISLERDKGNPNDRILRITKGNYVSEDLKNKILKIFPNDDFVFKSAGEFLVSIKLPNTSPRKIDDEIGGKIFMLHEQGCSIREIETILKSMGHNISKSSIYEFLKSTKGTVQCPES